MGFRLLNTIGLIGVGMAFMYVLDPSSGHRRRAIGKDKLLHRARMARRQGVTISRHVYNRGRGRIVSLISRMDHTPIGDEILTARIRSKLGRWVPHAHSVRVECKDGWVLLRGQLPNELKSAVLDHIREMPGVVQVSDYITQSRVEKARAA